jgi:N-methylhydantoinase A
MLSKYRLGVDAGGTFTDFVLAIRGGGVKLYKVLSTPDEPRRAIREGLQLIANDLQVAPQEIVSNADLCINGTTVGLNALIQLKGAKTGLLCTAGHEDSLEIRLGHKEDGYRYDAEYPPAPMLVPRHLRVPINERVLSTGEIRTPLDDAEVRRAAELFEKEGVRAVAISFIWSILDPAHERRAAQIVREVLPHAYVSLGSEIYPQIREYTRTSTAVVNAYLGPVMADYVAGIDAYFAEMGARSDVRYYQSNGGLSAGDSMTRRAVYAINSGPASAPQAALNVAGPLGIDSVITVDMGGTSFDITLTRNGRTNVTKNADFLRYRVGVPMIQVETLGAGGGSIGWIDSLGLLKVGPQSAGSTPGPACYGRGGTEPTVTDANVVLGYLDGTSLLEGRIPIDTHKARAALEKVAQPLGITVEQAAFGIFTIVNSNMVNGIRRVSVERGYDPRDFVLVAAGGATGVHITALARDMGIKKVLVPKLASGLCAFGQIISDVKYNYMASLPMRVAANADFTALNQAFARLEETGTQNLEADGFARDAIRCERSLDMRYVGQVHECTVSIPNEAIDASSIEKIAAAFHARHKELFTYSEPNSTVEIVNLESTIYGRVSKPTLSGVGPQRAEARAAVIGQRQMIFARDGIAIGVDIYDGARLGAGARVRGPAVIQEPTTTLLIEAGWTALLDASGTYVLTFER